jgi:hypothetical protein
MRIFRIDPDFWIQLESVFLNFLYLTMIFRLEDEFQDSESDWVISIHKVCMKLKPHSSVLDQKLVNFLIGIFPFGHLTMLKMDPM